MMKNLVRTTGIPVLAYSTSHAHASSCSLLIKYSESYHQATIFLQTSIPINGFDDEQTFILQYDADNLMPGDNSLIAVSKSSPPTPPKYIMRGDKGETYTLSLSLKEVCPVWCTPSPRPVSPKAGFYSTFHRLATLARAKEIHILFDYKWVHHDNRVLLQRLIHRPQGLTGVPVNKYATTYSLANWSVFGLFEAAGEVEEALPSHPHASHKRSGDVGSSSRPKAQDAKRLRLSPTTLLTEKTTTTTTTTPSSVSPDSSIAPALESQEAINTAVETLLPDMLESILPTLLSTMFTLPPSRISSPSTSPSPNTSTPPLPTPLSSLGTLLTTHLATHVQCHLDSIYAQTLDHASYIREVADAEAQDELEEYKVDIKMEMADGLENVERGVRDMLEKCRENAEEISEWVKEEAEYHAGNVYDSVREKLDKLNEMEKNRLDLRRQWAWLGLGGEVPRRESRRFAETRHGGQNIQRARAASAPL